MTLEDLSAALEAVGIPAVYDREDDEVYLPGRGVMVYQTFDGTAFNVYDGRSVESPRIGRFLPDEAVSGITTLASARTP